MRRVQTSGGQRAGVSRLKAGFTLVEILVVIAIVALITGLAAPAITSMLFGSALTVTSQQVIDQFAAARLSAITHNRTVQIRIFHYADVLHGNNPGYYALQTFLAMDAEAAVGVADPYTPQAKIFFLSRTLLINPTQASYSTLLSLSPSPTSVTLSNGVSATYIAINIYPDGSTNLSLTPTAPWTLTLDYGTGSQTAPVNYCTLVIDPATGRVSVYRP